MGTEVVGAWWVVQTKPQYEFRLRDDLARLHQFTFLPLETVRKTYVRTDGRRRTETWERPLFPSYLMFAGDRAAAFESDATIRVLSTTENDRQSIENLMEAQARGPVRRCIAVKVGEPVEIIAGPFQGIRGHVERLSDGKVYIVVKSLGCAEIETEPENIELDVSAMTSRVSDRQHGRRHELRSIGK